MRCLLCIVALLVAGVTTADAGDLVLRSAGCGVQQGLVLEQQVQVPLVLRQQVPIAIQQTPILLQRSFVPSVQVDVGRRAFGSRVGVNVGGGLPILSVNRQELFEVRRGLFGRTRLRRVRG